MNVLFTENRRHIMASANTVYQVAADVARWPDILPHYRFVDVLHDDGERRLVRMGARRSGIPVNWTSYQDLYPDRHEIWYQHVAGVTKGMHVIWKIAPGEGECDVTIEHRLEPRSWWLKSGPAQYIVGTVFVMHIADRTLRGVAQEAESRG